MKKEEIRSIIAGGVIILIAVSVFIATKRVGEYPATKPYEELTFTEKVASKLMGYNIQTKQELKDKGIIKNDIESNKSTLEKTSKEKTSNGNGEHKPAKSNWIAMQNGEYKEKNVYFDKVTVDIVDNEKTFSEIMPVLKVTEEIGINTYGDYWICVMGADKKMKDKSGKEIKKGDKLRITNSTVSDRFDGIKEFPNLLVSQSDLEIIN